MVRKFVRLDKWYILFVSISSASLRMKLISFSLDECLYVISVPLEDTGTKFAASFWQT
jgi:hypothetical protein